MKYDTVMKTNHSINMDKTREEAAKESLHYGTVYLKCKNMQY